MCACVSSLLRSHDLSPAAPLHHFQSSTFLAILSTCPCQFFFFRLYFNKRDFWEVFFFFSSAALFVPMYVCLYLCTLQARFVVDEFSGHTFIDELLFVQFLAGWGPFVCLYNILELCYGSIYSLKFLDFTFFSRPHCTYLDVLLG